MPFKQEGRICTLTTPLGEDVLLVRKAIGSEGVSRLFHYRLELLSEDDAIDFKAIVGRPAALQIVLSDGSVRFVHGIVARFAQGTQGDRYASYSAELVPWLWLLTRKIDCRIFQELTAPEIIRKVFDDLGFSDYELQLTGDYVKRVYCVQYRESCFDFVVRLMEEEGIFYYFRHDEKCHTLVLGDSPAACPECEKQPRIEYVRGEKETELKSDQLIEWQAEENLRTAQYSLQDYNFETPSLNLFVNTKASVENVQSYLEYYEFPGRYGSPGDGESLVKRRMEAEDAAGLSIRGRSTCRGLSAGQHFELIEHYRSDFNTKYLLLSVEHEITQGIGYEAAESSSYENSFTCMPYEVPFRPLPTIQKPLIPGSQTARVVGPAGEELHVDAFGRIKVQFHWDREGKKNEKSSCWIRVAHSSAGKNWGTVFLPRIGQEVVVEFLDGDPDCPLVTGVVYNGEAKPPYELPANATMSTIKTLSSKGGGGFNEIRFEDKKDEEQIFIHAQKNVDTRIKNDVYEEIGRDEHVAVKRNRIVCVEKDSHETVKQDDLREIGRDSHLKIVGKQAVEIQKSRSLTVSGDVIEVFKANHSEETTGEVYLKARAVVIEASQGLTLKSGSNSVVVDSVGVTLTGSLVVLDGKSVMIASGSGSPAASGSAGSAVSPKAPELPLEPDKADPGEVLKLKAEQAASGTGKYGKPESKAFTPAAADAEKKPSFIEIELVDEKGKPVPGEPYKLTLPDGSTTEGTLDEKGFVRIDGMEPGDCKVTFPRLDREAWKKA